MGARRCYICSKILSRETPIECACGIRTHQQCAVDTIHCPSCDRFLIFISDPDDTTPG